MFGIPCEEGSVRRCGEGDLGGRSMICATGKTLLGILLCPLCSFSFQLFFPLSCVDSVKCGSAPRITQAFHGFFVHPLLTLRGTSHFLWACQVPGHLHPLPVLRMTSFLLCTYSTPVNLSCPVCRTVSFTNLLNLFWPLIDPGSLFLCSHRIHVTVLSSLSLVLLGYNWEKNYI